MERTAAALKAALSAHPPATFYRVLALPPGLVTAEALAAARRELVRRCHPDLHPDARWAHDLTALVNKAHAVLSDPAERKTYDAQLRTHYAPCPECKGEGARLRAKGFNKVITVHCSRCDGEGWLPKTSR